MKRLLPLLLLIAFAVPCSAQVAQFHTPTIGGVAGLQGGLFNSGYSVIASNLNNLTSYLGLINASSASGSTKDITYRMEHFVVSGTKAVTNIRFAFGDWAGTKTSNYIMVTASYEPLSASGMTSQTGTRIPLTFSGRSYTYIAPGAMVISDPIQGLTLQPSQQFYSRTYASYGPINQEPGAPSITPSSSGGAIAAGTYYTVLTWVFPDFESFSGTATSETLTGSASSMVISVPSSPPPGAIGYRVYSSTASGGPYYAISPRLNLNQTCTIAYTPPSTASGTDVDQTAAYGFLGIPNSLEELGTTSYYGANNGEGRTVTSFGPLDYTTNQGTGNNATADNTAPAYSPVAVIGTTIDGSITPSVFMPGDSIGFGQDDNGWRCNGGGGYVVRGVMGASSLWWQEGLVPKYAILNSCYPGEKESQFLNVPVNIGRWSVSRLFTNFVDEYGINDIVQVSIPLSNLELECLQMGMTAQAHGQKFFQTTLTPDCKSTDGFQTVTNQTQVLSTANEATREGFDSWVRSSALTSSVTGETAIGTVNSSNKVFYFANAFVEGSESVTSNNVAQTYPTNYAYTDVATVQGITYADGITFVTAPTTGSVVEGYTQAPGFNVAFGGVNNCGFIDPCAYVEVNSAGTLTLNGGYWHASGSAIFSGTASTGTASTTLTDSGQSWTANSPTVQGYRGHCVYTGSGSTGYTACIAYNTSTVLTSFNGFYNTYTQASGTPTSAQSYIIYDPYTVDGLHPSSYGAEQASQAINLGAFR